MHGAAPGPEAYPFRQLHSTMVRCCMAALVLHGVRLPQPFDNLGTLTVRCGKVLLGVFRRSQTSRGKKQFGLLGCLFRWVSVRPPKRFSNILSSAKASAKLHPRCDSRTTDCQCNSHHCMNIGSHSPARLGGQILESGPRGPRLGYHQMLTRSHQGKNDSMRGTQQSTNVCATLPQIGPPPTKNIFQN